MATPVKSNQLITPYMAALEGFEPYEFGDVIYDVKDNSYIKSRAQSIASLAWGSTTNYDTRIMTKEDIVNSNIWNALEATSGYSDNQCVPYGILHDYLMNNYIGYLELSLNWGEDNIDTSYTNYGYVDVYLYSPYYHMKTWKVMDTKLVLWCWNNSSSFKGAENIYIYKGGPLYRLGDFTVDTQVHRTISWDGTWVCIMSTPWFCNAGIPSSKAYLSITQLSSSTSEIGGMDNSFWTPNHYLKNVTLSDVSSEDWMYELHSPVPVAGGTNGLRTKIYIY